jgi:galactose-1-phosphate uridylyltransferase
MLYTMPDGTIKQINPFTGTEVWTVPGRASRPLTSEVPKSARKIERREPEDYCNFCAAKYLFTPPEKERLVLSDGDYTKLTEVPAGRLSETTAEFRRVPNLFEIVTMDYWRKNHDYRLSDKNQAWKERYLADPEGAGHVRDILGLKMRLGGVPDSEIASMSDERLAEESDAFFGGGHELVIARRHYAEGAEYDSQLANSGSLTPREHYEYLKFTIDAMEDIYRNNRYVRYVCVFQNWLAPAGASFDHLHKQLVALDEWGASVEKEMDLVRNNPNIYNELIVNFAAYSNFTFAENEHAIALVEIGHRYPTLAVYSKSEAAQPAEHSEEEVRGFSNLVHACHAAMGPGIACNEEWYFSPRDCLVKMPWHILLKWRTNNPAGFEGGTKIYVNPIGPVQLRDAVVPRLYELRHERVIGGFKIAEECPLEPNCLKYYP